MSSRLVSGLVWTALVTMPGIYTTAAFAADAGDSSSPGEVPALEEIVVTAERREENIQGMSLSITALGGDDLLAEGKVRLEDALATIPGVSLQQNSNPGGTPFIRGIGPALGTDSATAVSLDGVYQSEGLFGSQFDVARVEVLRGPQGTLYGRNSTAGGVNVITNNPSQEFAGSASLQAGNYNAIRVEGMLNVPLSDKLALRAAFLSNDHDGYFSNGTGDEDMQAARVKLKYVPNDSITLLLATDYVRLGGKGLGSIQAPLSSHESNPWYTTALAGRQQSTRKSVYGQMDWDLGFGVLTYQPAWYEVQVYQDFDLIGLDLLITNKRSRQQTHELRLASSSDQSLKWLVGAYYLDNKGLEDQPAAYLAPGPHGGYNNPYDTPTEVESKAVFGQLTLPLGDAFRLIAGGRYTWDVKSASKTTYASSTIVGAPIVDITPSVSMKTNKFTYKVGAELDVTSKNLLYVTYSTAFKAGGINDSTGDFSDPNANATYRPETLQSIEVGSKNRFFDDRVQLNASAFKYDYTDFQVFTAVFTTATPLVAVLNADSATLWGGEIESTFLITPNDRLDLSMAYNHARFDKFIYFNSDYPPPTGLDRSGSRLPQAPEWTGALGYDHDFIFGSGTVLSLGGQVRLYTDSDTTIEPNLDSRQPGYSMVDAHASYKPKDSNWSLNAYVNNATDRVVRLFSANAGAARLTIGAPRTYGAGITASF